MFCGVMVECGSSLLVAVLAWQKKIIYSANKKVSTNSADAEITVKN